MTNGLIHDKYILDPLDAQAQGLGATTIREHYVYGIGRIDLTIKIKEYLVVIEAEMTNRRIKIDLKKVRAIMANELLIVCPNYDVIIKVNLKLGSLNTNGLSIYVFVLHQAMKRLNNLLTL